MKEFRFVPGIQDAELAPAESIISTGEWFITLLLLSIPFLSVVLLLFWSFGPGNRNRANFCRAVLIFMIIGLALGACAWSLNLFRGH